MRARVCACTCMCVRTKTTRRESRRNGPFYLFIQLSSGAFSVGVTFPLVLRLLSFPLSFTEDTSTGWSESSSSVVLSPLGPHERSGCFQEQGERDRNECVCVLCWPQIPGYELAV